MKLDKTKWGMKGMLFAISPIIARHATVSSKLTNRFKPGNKVFQPKKQSVSRQETVRAPVETDSSCDMKLFVPAA